MHRGSAADPVGVVAAREPRPAVVELQRHGLDAARPVLLELDEEEQPEVVPQLAVDRVVVDEVAEVVQDVRLTPWKTCAEWPATSVAPASRSACAAARTYGSGSDVMFGPQCGVTSAPRALSRSQSGTPRSRSAYAIPGRSGSASASRGWSADGDDADALDDRRRPRLVEVRARADPRDPGRAQVLERVEQRLRSRSRARGCSRARRSRRRGARASRPPPAARGS